MGGKLFGFKPRVGWVQFTVAVTARFFDENLDRAIENFNKLA